MPLENLLEPSMRYGSSASISLAKERLEEAHRKNDPTRAEPKKKWACGRQW
jgi:hypothetical protein